jgi:hypothetical protein
MSGATHELSIVLIAVAAALVLVVWPYSRIFKKAGFSPFFSLLLIVPVVNLITLWVFALSDWPALRRNGGPDAP